MYQIIDKYIFNLSTDIHKKKYMCSENILLKVILFVSKMINMTN